PWLRDTVRGRFYRTLGSLAAATNRGREIEVALEWLDAQEMLPADALAACERLASKWQRERRAATRQFDRRLASKFITVTARLRNRLGFYQVPAPSDAQAENPAARGVVAQTIRTQAEALAAALPLVRSASDAVAAHRARIAGKRLRYLLEPISRNRGASKLIDRLAELQDLLGDFHDAHQLSERLAGARPAGETAGETGIGELERRVQARARECFERLELEWHGQGLASLIADVGVVADRVARVGAARRRREKPRDLRSA
ncbi:MAG TPA: CHAD domain-containing protein, partial [Gemmatimonadaceae bacterium]|nr:CHAD domain-containing protein [Gemmatimonadaceae bacterium]